MDDNSPLYNTLANAVDAFFEEVDPEAFETDDLVLALIRAMESEGLA